MAHTILGIDLGTYAVKVAQLQASFRAVRLLGLAERPLLPPLADTDRAEPLLSRQIRTLVALLAELGIKPEMSAAALSGEVTLRVITLPLTDRKKIEQVLPFEMEGQLLCELEDQVIDHTVAQTGIAVEDGVPGCRVVAAAAPREAVHALLDPLTRAGLEPRLLGAQVLSLCALAGPEVNPGGQPALIVDFGHRSCHVCVAAVPPTASHSLSRGYPAPGSTAATFARTIARGSEQLTEAIARALRVDAETAERLKHEADVRPGAPERGAAAALRQALRPLLRDLKQTVASYGLVYGAAPRQLLLAGGGARLSGFAELLAEELALPVQPLPLPAALLQPGPEAAPLPVSAEAQGSCLSALGLALAVAAPAPQVNFRKGEFAYRTDYSFLREKAPQLALLVLAILVCAGLVTLASYHSLKKEAEQLQAALRTETMALFGEPRTDGEAVSAELSSVIASARGSGQSVPTTSAFDLLDEISRAVPPSSKGKLDVSELNIRPKKTDIKGTASSAQYIEEMEAALRRIPCFKQVDKGKLVTVTNTGPDGKPIEVKQFTFNIATTCP
jgi:general secretion pathway protein L